MKTVSLIHFDAETGKAEFEPVDVPVLPAGPIPMPNDAFFDAGDYAEMPGHLANTVLPFMAGADLMPSPAADQFALPVDHTMYRDEEKDTVFADVWEGPIRYREICAVMIPGVTTVADLEAAELDVFGLSIRSCSVDWSAEAKRLSEEHPSVRFDVWSFVWVDDFETKGGDKANEDLEESYVAGEEVDCEEGGAA